jgi:hypothetical protein
LIHTVTLDESDIKEAVRKHIESNFPGYTVGRLVINHDKATSPMETSQTTIKVDLGRPSEGKD